MSQARRWVRTILLALWVAAAPVVVEASARALPYPSTWPARASSACSAIVGQYLNQPIAVEDAGQRMQALRLSDLLGMSASTGGPLRTGGREDEGGSTWAERHGAARLALARERVSISFDDDRRLVVAVNDEPGPTSSTACCQARSKHEPAVEVDSRSLEERSVAEAPLGHLARIGIRQVKTTLFSTVGGDLILGLTVTKHLEREETFGYPPLKQYWFRFARFDSPAD